MELTEIHILPPSRNGRFLKEFTIRASFEGLSNLLGFIPTGPNSREYHDQHGVGTIFGFRDTLGNNAWIWKDDNAPLALETSVHRWAVAGDQTLLYYIMQHYREPDGMGGRVGINH